VSSMRTKVILGKEKKSKWRLDASAVSKSVNISFIERNTLTIKQDLMPLGRKTNGFSKGIGKLET